MELLKLLSKIYKSDIDATDILEGKYAAISELKIDHNNSYEYIKSEYKGNPSWEFEDRCGNNLVAVCITSINEFKVGYKVKGLDYLIFDPKKLESGYDFIKPCPDERRVNTVYSILINEVIPKYLLNSRPNKLQFNPVSNSRKRLVDIIINKVLDIYPQLLKRNHYLIYK